MKGMHAFVVDRLVCRIGSRRRLEHRSIGLSPECLVDFFVFELGKFGCTITTPATFLLDTFTHWL
jgi:hypothetical protein